MATLTRRQVEGLDDPNGFFLELQRRDFGLFVRAMFPLVNGGADLKWNWHLDAICYELSKIENGDCLRLLVALPPRNLKSFMISVAWVAWMLGRNPSLNFVGVSYSGELAQKLARQCLNLMQNDRYREIFPKTIISKKRTAAYDFETIAGGGRLATSITGTLTGRGGDIIIIDDPIKPDEAQSDTVREAVNDWYRTTLASRLNDKQSGAIICVMQRLHQYDLAGLMITDGGWRHLSLPAIAKDDCTIRLTRGRIYRRKLGDVLHPDREPAATLERIKAEQGSIIFEAQYQQNPVPADGNMISASWLRYVDPTTGIPEHGEIIQSWDTASKDGIHNDYSVCITAKRFGNDIYIIDVYRGRLNFPELKKAATRLANEHRAHALLIEDAASGQQLYQTLRAECPHGVPVPSKQKPEGDKKTRLAGVSSMIEAGQLILPKAAPWLAEFQSELLAFPNARHDDQVDALSQLLGWVRRQYVYDDVVVCGAIVIGPNDPYDNKWLL